MSVVESFNLRGGMEIFSFCLMLVGVGGGARGGSLVSSWDIGFVRVWVGYISVFLVTATDGFALTATHFFTSA